MDRISKMSVSSMRSLAACTTDIQILWKVFKAASNDIYTIQNIVDNPIFSSDPALLLEVYNCGDDVLRASIVDKTSDEDLIDVAACSKDIVERIAAAKNPYIRFETLKRLATDPWWGVRLSVLDNPKVTVKMVKALSTDEHRLVKRLALSILKS